MQYSTPGFQCVPLLQALNGYKLDREDIGPELEGLPAQNSPEDEDEDDKEQQLSDTENPSPQ